MNVIILYWERLDVDGVSDW